MLGLLLTGCLALAAPSVRWTAPSGCPDAATAKATIAAGLDADADIEVVADVTESADGFAATVRIVGADGETSRALSSPQCTTLLDAVALIAAAAQAERLPEPDADPETDPEPDPETEPETEPDPEPDPQPDLVPPEAAATLETSRVQTEATDERAASSTIAGPTSSADAPRPKRAAPRSIAPHLRAFGLVGWSTTPVVDAGGGVAAGFSWTRLRVEAFGRVIAPTRVAVAGTDSATASAWAWSAGGRGCGAVWTDADERFAALACGGASVGQVVGRATGQGLAERTTLRQVWAAAHLGPAGVLRLSRIVSLVVDVNLLIPFVRPGFAIRGVGTVHRPAAAGVAGTVGIELHFPRRIRRRPGIG